MGVVSARRREGMEDEVDGDKDIWSGEEEPIPGGGRLKRDPEPNFKCPREGNPQPKRKTLTYGVFLPLDSIQSSRLMSNYFKVQFSFGPRHDFGRHAPPWKMQIFPMAINAGLLICLHVVAFPVQKSACCVTKHKKQLIVLASFPFAREFWYSMLCEVGLQQFAPQLDESCFDDWREKIWGTAPDQLRNGINSLVVVGAWTL
ncbi:hypothetical protein EJB05_51823, partial [Eragrostis curvula]